MIDLLIKLAEKLLDLLQHRRGAPEERFNRHVMPIFRDLTVVHQAYVRMFTNCTLMLRDQTDLSLVADALFSERLQQEGMRRSIIALAESLGSAKQLTQFQAFFLAVRSYFYAGGVPTDTRSSALLNEIERCVRAAKSGKPESLEFSTDEMHQFLALYVDKALGEIRHSWVQLSELYASVVKDTLV